MTTPPAPPADDGPLTGDTFRAGIEHLIQRFLADTPAMETGWVLMFATAEPGAANLGGAGYGLHYPTHQPPHITRGLLANASNRVDVAQQRDLYAFWAAKDTEGDDQ